MTAKALFRAQPSLEGLPLGRLNYASMRYVRQFFPKHLMDLVVLMSRGIEDPRISYRCHELVAGQMIGHARWHQDGKLGEDKEGEIHRLITINGVPTLGFIGDGDLDEGPHQVLHAGTVWEYDGDYWHKARPVETACKRLMLRVSKTNMRYRNHWSRR